MSEEREVMRVKIPVGGIPSAKGAPAESLTEKVEKYEEKKIQELECPEGFPLESWNQLNDDEKKDAIRKVRKAVYAQVLERGVVNARLAVPNLPPHLHGEWVADDEVDIHRMESLGFQIDTEYARRRRLHSKGDAASYVGDVLFMTCRMEDYEILQEIKQERFDKIHGVKKPSQKEETDFTAQVRAKTPELPVIEESRVREVRKEELQAAIAASKKGV